MKAHKTLQILEIVNLKDFHKAYTCLHSTLSNKSYFIYIA